MTLAAVEQLLREPLFWLFPLCVLGALGGAFLLVDRWQKAAGQSLARLRAGLRRLPRQRQQLAAVLKAYAEEEREPYGSRVAVLQRQAGQADQEMLSLEREYVTLREAMRRASQDWWLVTFGALHFWRQVEQRAAGMLTRGGKLEAALQSALDEAQSLAGLAWETALQSRQARELQREVTSLLNALRARGAGGDRMDAAARQEEQCRARLAIIPRYFLIAEETALLEQAEIESVADVHAILAETRPVLEEIHAQAQTWEQRCMEAEEKAAAMQQRLKVIERRFERLPASLDLSPLRARLAEQKEAAQRLLETLGQVDVEVIQAASEEAVGIQQAAEELEAALHQVAQQAAELEAWIPDLAQGMQTISGLFADLARHEIHPILWDRSRDLLTAISREAAALGPARKARTPEQLELDLANVREQLTRQKDLAGRCREIAEQHAELAALLESPELAQGLAWCQEARNLVERVRAYDPGNWPNFDRVADLADELDAFTETLQRLVTGKRSEPLAETELAARLEETRAFAITYNRFRVRVENIEARLLVLQDLEKQARAELEAARTGLNQAGLLVRSNAILDKAASREIERMKRHNEQLLADLDDRLRGTIERKAKAAHSQAEKVLESASAWLGLLEENIQEQKFNLGAKLTLLETIAPLDEPAVAEAQRLLNNGHGIGGNGASKQAHPSGLNGVLLDLRRCSDYWQACSAAIHALQDVERPVAENYRAARENRDYAREQLAEVATWLRSAAHGSARPWPPTSFSLDAERQELDRLDAHWETLKQKPTQAITLVAQLGALAAKYQAFGEKIEYLSGRAVQEQDHIASLEAELDELVELWQRQSRVYQDNPWAAGEIQKLLQSVDSERSALKRRYRQGSKSYDAVLQTLQTLHRRLRLAQIAVGENHVIDINGRIIA